jgi:hypothetical protein
MAVPTAAIFKTQLAHLGLKLIDIRRIGKPSGVKTMKATQTRKQHGLCQIVTR